MEQHWHAYTWIGNSRPDDKLRTDPSQPHPPLEIMHWLKKPRGMIAETFTGIDPAVDWLAKQLAEHPPLDSEAFPVEARLDYARQTLAQTAGADVVWGYYSTGARYVSRSLVSCPRERLTPMGEHPPACPNRTGTPR